MAAKRIYELAKKLLSKPKQTLKEKIQNDPQAKALVEEIFLTEPIAKQQEEFRQFEEIENVRRAYCQNRITSYQEAKEMKATDQVRVEQAPLEFTCNYWMGRLNKLRESGDFSEGCRHIQEAVEKIQNANSIEDFDEIPEMMYLTPRPGYVRFSAVCSITKRPIRYAFAVSEKLPNNKYKIVKYECSVILSLIKSGQKPENWPKGLPFLKSSGDELSETYQEEINETLEFEFIQWKEGVHYNDFK